MHFESLLKRWLYSSSILTSSITSEFCRRGNAGLPVSCLFPIRAKWFRCSLDGSLYPPPPRPVSAANILRAPTSPRAPEPSKCYRRKCLRRLLMTSASSFPAKPGPGRLRARQIPSSAAAVFNGFSEGAEIFVIST